MGHLLLVSWPLVPLCPPLITLRVGANGCWLLIYLVVPKAVPKATSRFELDASSKSLFVPVMHFMAEILLGDHRRASCIFNPWPLQCLDFIRLALEGGIDNSLRLHTSTHEGLVSTMRSIMSLTTACALCLPLGPFRIPGWEQIMALGLIHLEIFP